MTKKFQNVLLVFISLILAELCLYGFGKFILHQNLANRKIKLKSNQIRILTLGESTTALGGKDSYPRQLEGILNISNKKYKVYNGAIPGQYLDQMMRNLKDNIRKFKPHIIITMAGINDLLLGTPYKEPSYFEIYKPRIYKLFEYIFINFFKVDTVKRKIEHSNLREDIKANPELKKKIELLSREISPSIYIKNLMEQYQLIIKHPDLKTISPITFFKLTMDLVLKFCPTYSNECHLTLEEFTKWNLNTLNTSPKYFLRKFYLDEVLNIYKLSEYEDLSFIYALENYFANSDLNNREFISFKINRFLCARDDKCTDYDQDFISHLYSNNRYIIKKMRELISIAKENNIHLIISGYASMDIEELKDNIDSTYPLYNSLKVPFNEALKESSYDDIFTDQFALTFGHATKKGNKIIAQTLAKLILEKSKF